MSAIVRYFVEGDCEKAFLKAHMFLETGGFVEGKIEVFNFVNQKMSKAYARTIKRNSTVIIVNDTDTNNNSILEYNINLLKNVSLVKEENIIVLQSVRTFEEEIVYSCSKIKNINEVFHTKSVNEFKTELIAHKDLYHKFEKLGFDINKIWSRKANSPFDKYECYRKNIKK